jgi:molybdenum cofactor biosynthesis enzyme
MAKAVDRTMHLTDVRLVAKSGGQSGDYSADE